MKHRLFYFLSAIILLGFASCSGNKKKLSAKEMVTEWIGKEIILPADIKCTYLGRDTLCPDANTPYKILLYTDSIGCTNCKLRLYQWNDLIEETLDSMRGKVSFHFYFQPKNEKELPFLLRRDNFRQAVYIDKESKLYAANKLPDNMNYQCFLLDKDNKVLLIGNPTLNPKVWDLYKQTITGKASDVAQKNMVYTTVEAEQTEIELKDTRIQQTSIATFVLKNTGDAPLLIKTVSASCGCTVPEWEKTPIPPGGKTEIKVKVTPDASGYFRKTITVFFNTQAGSVPLVVTSMVKE